jgi:hypothetical protein
MFFKDFVGNQKIKIVPITNQKEFNFFFLNYMSETARAGFLLYEIENYDFLQGLEEDWKKGKTYYTVKNYIVGLHWFFKQEFDNKHKIPYSPSQLRPHKPKGEVFRKLFKLIEGIFSRTNLSHLKDDLDLTWSTPVTCFFRCIMDFIYMDMHHAFWGKEFRYRLPEPTKQQISKNTPEEIEEWKKNEIRRIEKSKKSRPRETFYYSELIDIASLKRLENPYSDITTFSKVYDLGIGISEKVTDFKLNYWDPYVASLRAESEFKFTDDSWGMLSRNGEKLKESRKKPRKKPIGFD